MKRPNLFGGVISLLGLIVIVALGGCGGGSSSSGGSTGGPSYVLKSPVEIPTQPGSIGGSVFTMAANGSDPTIVLDNAMNAQVNLSGTTAAGASYTAQTPSIYRGGYCFASVPAGTYTVSATAASGTISGLTLSGSVSGVVVKGNIPTVMVNLLLGQSGKTCIFNGAITQDGKAAAGAVVSVDVTAHTPDYTQNTSAYSSVILSTNATSAGSYQIVVPTGGTDYYIAAHSDTSMVAQTNDITQPAATNLENLDLSDATSPVFANATFLNTYPDNYCISTTLPAATVQAANQALISRLALARALHAPPSRLRHLQQLYQGTRGTRIINGIVENDLAWSLSPVDPEATDIDVGVLGFHIYRAGTLTNPFMLVNVNRDPYMEYFFDNDPILSDLQSRYYTVTSYAANGVESAPATAILMQPLPQITVQGPAAPGSTVSLSSGAFTWAPVAGAQSYAVLKYTSPPTFNDSLVGNFLPHGATETSEAMSNSGLTPGTYWWAVEAFNTTTTAMDNATAISCSPFQQVVVTP